MACFTCPVCEESFPSAKLLPCRHQFCAACVDEWAAQSPDDTSTCPSCRGDFAGPAERLPSIRYAELPCHFCKSSFPTFVLKFCERCGELICGNCAHAEGGIIHDPRHHLQPFAQLSFVRAVIGSLKRKASEELVEVSPKLRKLSEAFAGELVAGRSLGARHTPLVESIVRGFGVSEGGEEGQTSQPELKARQLIQVLGSEAPPSSGEYLALSEYLEYFDEAWARRAARNALRGTASRGCQTEGAGEADQQSSEPQETSNLPEEGEPEEGDSERPEPPDTFILPEDRKPLETSRLSESPDLRDTSRLSEVRDLDSSTFTVDSVAEPVPKIRRRKSPDGVTTPVLLPSQADVTILSESGEDTKDLCDDSVLITHSKAGRKARARKSIARREVEAGETLDFRSSVGRFIVKVEELRGPPLCVYKILSPSALSVYDRRGPAEGAWQAFWAECESEWDGGVEAFAALPQGELEVDGLRVYVNTAMFR